VTGEDALARANSLGIEVRFASAQALRRFHFCAGGIAFVAQGYPAMATVLGRDEVLLRPLIVIEDAERESAATILHEVGHIYLKHHNGIQEGVREVQAWAYAILSLERPMTPQERQDVSQSLRSHGVSLRVTRVMFDQIKEMTQ
jgi:hypothetical protein